MHSETKKQQTKPLHDLQNATSSQGYMGASNVNEKAPATQSTKRSAGAPLGKARSTKNVVTCGLLVALLVISCFFTIPLGPVPFTLQTAVIILMALLLSPGQAAAACGIYLLMGAIGLPVFSGMTGGFGKFLGPTGGFLISYPIATATASFLRRTLERRGAPQLACDVVAGIFIITIADLFGWFWFMLVTGSDPLSAFLVSDAPFIFIDCCKGALAILVAAAVRKATGWERAINNSRDSSR